MKITSPGPWVLLFQTRQEEVEVHHRLVVFAFLVDHVLGLRDPARRVGLEDHPTLPAVRHRVPGRGAVRVGVHCRPGALRPDAEPAIRRLLRLGREIEEVMRDVIMGSRGRTRAGRSFGPRPSESRRGRAGCRPSGDACGPRNTCTTPGASGPCRPGPPSPRNGAGCARGFPAPTSPSPANASSRPR